MVSIHWSPLCAGGDRVKMVPDPYCPPSAVTPKIVPSAAVKLKRALDPSRWAPVNKRRKLRVGLAFAGIDRSERRAKARVACKLIQACFLKIISFSRNGGR